MIVTLAVQRSSPQSLAILYLKISKLWLKSKLPWYLSSKEFACSSGDAGDLGLIPGSERSPEKEIAQSKSIWEVTLSLFWAKKNYYVINHG